MELEGNAKARMWGLLSGGVYEEGNGTAIIWFKCLRGGFNMNKTVIRQTDQFEWLNEETLDLDNITILLIDAVPHS
jgi:hypothetical protein